MIIFAVLLCSIMVQISASDLQLDVKDQRSAACFIDLPEELHHAIITQIFITPPIELHTIQALLHTNKQQHNAVTTFRNSHKKSPQALVALQEERLRHPHNRCYAHENYLKKVDIVYKKLFDVDRFDEIIIFHQKYYAVLHVDLDCAYTENPHKPEILDHFKNLAPLIWHGYRSQDKTTLLRYIHARKNLAENTEFLERYKLTEYVSFSWMMDINTYFTGEQLKEDLITNPSIIFEIIGHQDLLYCAICEKNERATKLLLRHRANPNTWYRYNKNELSALSWAIENGNAPVVQLLCEYGANPNLPNYDGSTPFNKAVRFHPKNSVFLDILLAHGLIMNNYQKIVCELFKSKQ